MIARARERRTGGRATIFFLDEIHRFNKAQQDALLPAVEEGLVTLIGATTENPYFEVNNALLSRTQIYELQELTEEHLQTLLRRALERGEYPDGDGPGRRDRVPRRARRRRRPDRAQRARARVRDRHRRDGHAGRRRGRHAAQGGPLRQGRRPALRLHLGLDQGHARLGPGRVAVLPRRDARGRRGRALHRPADGHPRLRGHRQRRSAGAADRRRGRPRDRARRPARGPVRARPGRDLPVAGAEVGRRQAGDRRGPRPHPRRRRRASARRPALGRLPGRRRARPRHRLRLPARPPAAT